MSESNRSASNFRPGQLERGLTFGAEHLMHGSSTVALLGPVASLRLCSSSLLAQLGFTVGTEEVTFLRAGVGSLDRSEVFLHRVHERVPVLAMLREVPHAEQKGKEKRAGAVEVAMVGLWLGWGGACWAGGRGAGRDVGGEKGGEEG